MGENQAVKYLKKQKCKILEKNYKNYIGEIDIICKDKEYTVFVEVKTRVNDSFGAPSEAVNRQKQQKYFKVATEYLQKRGLLETPCRFDVIEIEDGKINHIKDAFYM
ncbi:MAG: YraN family protein [Clostridia bacterium]|nr:YraN family protein [Clostridia bacterium]